MKKSITLTVISVILLAPISGFSQEQGILKYLDKHSVTLSERQQELLKAIESRPQTKAVYLIQIDETRFDLNRNAIRINLPEKIIGVQQQTSEYGISQSSWHGKVNSNPVSTIVLSIDGDDVT